MTVIAPSSTRRAARLASTFVVVALVSLLLGGLTSFAQGFLPHALAPFANSASGWTLLTVLIVWACRQGTAVSAVLGVVAFLGLVYGYVLTSELRGVDDSEALFTVAAIVVGPFVGIAAAWLRRRGLAAALAAGLLSGIGLGEAAYGLTAIRDTTGWFYWTLIAVLALVLLVGVLLTRVVRWRHRLAGVALAVVLAGAFLTVYLAL